MFDLSAYLEHHRQLINRALEARLPAADCRPAALHQAMRYSLFSGGKRLRPIVCLAANAACGGTAAAGLIPALAIEALHTYTLIHDDLPAMDNDSLRRGQPTCHIAFGEATAILAGDALLTLAFEWLAQARTPNPLAPQQLALELAQAAGSQGIIGGQIEDLEAEGQPACAARLHYIHLHKTARLWRAAARMGAIAAGAAPSLLEALSQYGANIGLAFQIMDDVLNETSSAQALGKAVHSDRRRHKMTAVTVHGLDAAQQQAAQLTRAAVEALQIIPGDSEPLRAVAQFMSTRTH